MISDVKNVFIVCVLLINKCGHFICSSIYDKNYNMVNLLENCCNKEMANPIIFQCMYKGKE